MASRITPLPDISSLNVEQLKEEAKKLHEQLWNIVSNMYSLEERFKRQQYDVGYSLWVSRLCVLSMI